MPRPEQPEPFLRGCAFPASRRVPYPRADPADARIPRDTWRRAAVPAGVRLELVGDAEAVEVAYRTAGDDLGYRPDGGGRRFALWRDGELVAEEKPEVGEGRVRLSMGHAPADVPAIVYLPEDMDPTVLSVTGVGVTIEPAPRQPRWLAYGDSVAEGWVASAPALAWPAVAGRDQGLDVVNLGYAGAARGELASAEQVAGLEADVISVSHGTNCWTMTPHSIAMMRAAVSAFLDVVRQGHPQTPLVVVSPVLRPDAETTPNRLGATLTDLRAAMEEAATERIEAGDGHLTLLPGADLLGPVQLADGIHPDDDGHRALAAAIGPLLERRR